MELKGINKVYLIGIGGIGMSALARHFHFMGVRVGGYDRTATALTRQLENEGMDIHYTDSIELLDRDADLVIYTPAVPDEHRELSYYREHAYAVKKRAEVLGLLTNAMKGLAVAGSHGKTSTCSLLNHILQTSGYDCAAFLGGISINYASNYISGGEWAIAEADEFDRSFHQLRPECGIITSVDTDHLDVYGDYDAIRAAFRQFAAQVSSILIHHADIPTDITAAVSPNTSAYSYSLDTEADFRVENLEVAGGKYLYNATTPEGRISGLEMTGGGRHNVENSLGALALATRIGVHEDHIREAIRTYKGVQRRFEIHIQRPDMIYIDDYAHHPREIEVTLQTTRELFPGRRLTVVFQPHLYSRTRDLADGLAAALSKADEVLLLEIYPARELPIEGITSGVIYRMLKTSKYLVTKNQVITKLNELYPELVLTVGAGDIDTLVSPIIKNFN
jgi:UDP-N-acetylmuramate--alanine ligase